MAVAGEIVINVLAKTAGYTKGLQQAQTITTRFQSTILSSLGSLQSWGAGLLGIGAAATAAAKALSTINASLERIDTTAKQSSNIGLLYDQLEGLQEAALEAGSSPEALVKGLGFLSRNIADAAAGSGAAVEALNALQLDPAQLKAGGTYKAFLDIADAMNRVGNDADRTRFAVDLFGRAGIELIATLRSGSKSLNEFTNEAMRTGPLQQQIANVEKANDAWSRMKKTMSGFTDSMAAKTAPVFQAIADIMEGLNDSLKRNVAITERITQASMPSAVKAIDVWKAYFQQREGRLQRWVETIEQIGMRTRTELAAMEREAQDRAESRRKLEESIQAPQYTGAVMRGTTEAFEAIMESRAEQQRLISLEQAQLEQQQKMVGVLGGIQQTLLGPLHIDQPAPATVVPGR